MGATERMKYDAMPTDIAPMIRTGSMRMRSVAIAIPARMPMTPAESATARLQSSRTPSYQSTVDAKAMKPVTVKTKKTIAGRDTRRSAWRSGGVQRGTRVRLTVAPGRGSIRVCE